MPPTQTPLQIFSLHNPKPVPKQTNSMDVEGFKKIPSKRCYTRKSNTSTLLKFHMTNKKFEVLGNLPKDLLEQPHA